MSRAIILLPLYAFMAWTRTTLRRTFLLSIMVSVITLMISIITS
jgi:hypothetical protein